MNTIESEKNTLLSENYKGFESSITNNSQKVSEILITQAIVIWAVFFWILNTVAGNSSLNDSIILLKLSVILFGLVIVFNIIYLISKLDVLQIDFINTAFEKSSKWKFKMKNLWKKLNSRIIFSNISKYSLILSLSFFLVWLVLMLVFLWINL